MIAPDHARRAYDAFAEVYDAFTAHHRYDEWTANLERLAVDAGLRGRRLLDVACGTGKSFLPFVARGFEVTACDVSPRMAALAAEKAAGRARVEVHDMRDLPVLGAFDLVTCLDDAVNYLLEPAEVAAALRGMRRNLAPGGVVVFDANTLATYRGFFASLSVVPNDEVVLVWRGRAPPDTRAGARVCAKVEVLARDGDGAWRSDRHVHHQRHHPEPVVHDALAAAGLRAAGVHGMRADGSFHAGVRELESSKAVYVAVAAGDSPGAPAP